VRRRAPALAAIPKSIKLMLSSSSTMMFSGFMSRWTTPLAWMYSSARQMPMVSLTARSMGALAAAENLAEEAAGDPLHDHVDLGAAGVGEDLHDGGWLRRVPMSASALEGARTWQGRTRPRVGDLDGDLRAGAGVDGAEDGGHAAGGHQLFEVVVVELIAGGEW